MFELRRARILFRPVICLASVAALLLLPVPIPAQSLCEIGGLEWVSIGDAGNAADPLVMSDGTSGYGSVAYPYEISTYEITNAQYAAFLNAVAQTDPNGLYQPYMAYDGVINDISREGGILQSGAPGSYAYAVKPGFACKPVNWVSIYSALRFANWLHNGQPNGAQDASTTEDGAYFFTGPTAVGARKPAALVFLPNENEWYKAAYFDPATQPTPSYHAYPARDDAATTCAEAPDNASNTANCYRGAFIPGVFSFVPSEAAVVGSYPSSSSAYGTYDQGGNIREFIDPMTTLSGDNPSLSLRGGSYFMFPLFLAASSRTVDTSQGLGSGFGPWGVSFHLGFRVARAAPDADGDGIPDVLDKCLDVPNAGALSCDTDHDGYGNVCDGDFDQDYSTSSLDFGMYFAPAFKGFDPAPWPEGMDMDCDGAVNATDFGMYFAPQFQTTGKPGPSGLACAGTVPCF